MSVEVNTKFLERVAEFIDETEGMATIPATAEQLLKEQNYEALEVYMNNVEASLAQDYFHNYDLVGENDIY